MEFLDVLTILLDLPIPLAIVLDILLIFTFTRSRELCPVFAWCINNIFLTHMAIYICEIVIRLPALFGFFLPFFKANQQVVGKIFFIVMAVWHPQCAYWNCVMAVSRLWSILSSFTFKKFWTQKVRWVTTAIIWAVNLAMTVHIIVNVDCRYWVMGENSISFGTVTPNIITTLYSTYPPNIALILAMLCYAWLSLALSRMKTIPSKVARQTVIAQFLINLR
ncbi:unnamed protein product, partial [Mesorhabditis spiculigera]